MIQEINNDITMFLNDFLIENKLEVFVWFMSDAPIFFLPVFLLWAWFYYTFKEKNNEKKSDLLNIFFATFIAVVINIIIQQFFSHIQRPDTIIKPILEHVPDASFPSDHAAVSFAFLTGLFLAWYKKTFYLFITFVILMNFSRLAWGLHWITDVIVWALIWIITAIIFFKIIKHTKIIKKINNFIIKLMNYIRL